MNKDHDDILIIKLLQKGNVEAFDSVYEKYSGKLYLFGLKYLRSETEAEELVQDVFLKIWENHKSVNTELSFKSYIFTIAYNYICKYFRKKNYNQNFICESTHSSAQASSETEEKIDFGSSFNRVMQIIDKLPARQKEIIIKSRIEGKRTKEIAEELNLAPGTVDNYASEAIRFIKRHLKGEDLVLILFLFLL